MTPTCLANVAATGRQWEPLVGPGRLDAATVKHYCNLQRIYYSTAPVT